LMGGSRCPPEEDVEKVGLLLELTVVCLRASSVVSCMADTHDFIWWSLIVWNRCSEDGLIT